MDLKPRKNGLDDALFAALRKRAKERGQTKSEAMRQILINALIRRKK